MRKLALILAAAMSITPVHGASRRHIVGRPTEPRFGVVLNVAARPDGNQIGRALDMARDAGIEWVRIPFLWSMVQPTAGVTDFRLYDQIVPRARQDNLHVVGVLGFATQWNTTAPKSETRAAQREHYPPADYDAWGRYVFSTVLLYKNTVHYWEVWNAADVGSTPDDTHPCNGSWCGTAAQFAHLLSLAYTNIKKADPTATVILGPLALAGTEQNPNFLNDILSDPTYPAVDTFEVMAFQAYGSKSEALRRMNIVKSQLAFGGSLGRPIWTEFGYTSDKDAQNVAPYFNGESGQAAYLKDMAPYLLSIGARKVFWNQMLDSDPAVAAGDPFASFGLLTVIFGKKQSYDAYTTVMKSYAP